MECSKKYFDHDFGDLADICSEDAVVAVICEGCEDPDVLVGTIAVYIYVDHTGKRIPAGDVGGMGVPT
jgi:hypothetical protein